MLFFGIKCSIPFILLDVKVKLLGQSCDDVRHLGNLFSSSSFRELLRSYSLPDFERHFS